MAAAGAPPADFGGDRVFIDDPESKGISTALGDVAAAVLQMSHYLSHYAHNDDKPRIANLANAMRTALATSDASYAREASTRELQPVTRVPAVPFGNKNGVANIRMHGIPSFSGTSSDTEDIVQWISRIFNLAQSNELSYDATINLLIQGSSKGAANYIDEMKNEGKTLHQIIQQLEMRYGSLTTVEDARVKCNNMVRRPSEGLSEFIDRLRIMARMACRMERNDAARRNAVDVLVEGNIRRVLPTSVRNALEERIINRNRIGLPAFTAREIEKECLDLEKRRNERKLELIGAPVKRVNVRQAIVDDDTEQSSDSSDEEETEEENGNDLLINEVKQQHQKYLSRGRPVDSRKVWKRAIKNYNTKYPIRPNYNKGHQHGARQAMGAAAPMGAPAQGPPNRMGNSFKPISELQSLSNCARGQCFQCGFDGHNMRSMACALKDKILTDRACAKCGKGLHSADDCPKVYQQGYKAPQQGANIVQGSEPLNDE
jgi:hypothetical protein